MSPQDLDCLLDYLPRDNFKKDNYNIFDMKAKKYCIVYFTVCFETTKWLGECCRATLTP